MTPKAAIVTRVTTADVARIFKKKSCDFKGENQSKILSHLTQEKTSCNTENVTVTASNSGHNPVPIKDTTAQLGITAVIAIMEPATESQFPEPTNNL